MTQYSDVELDQILGDIQDLQTSIQALPSPLTGGSEPVQVTSGPVAETAALGEALEEVTQQAVAEISVPSIEELEAFAAQAQGIPESSPEAIQMAVPEVIPEIIPEIVQELVAEGGPEPQAVAAEADLVAQAELAIEMGQTPESALSDAGESAPLEVLGAPEAVVAELDAQLVESAMAAELDAAQGAGIQIEGTMMEEVLSSVHAEEGTILNSPGPVAGEVDVELTETSPESSENNPENNNVIAGHFPMADGEGTLAVAQTSAMSIDLRGTMSLNLSYEANGCGVSIAFADGFLHVKMVDGTEFKLPLKSHSPSMSQTG